MGYLYIAIALILFVVALMMTILEADLYFIGQRIIADPLTGVAFFGATYLAGLFALIKGVLHLEHRKKTR